MPGEDEYAAGGTYTTGGVHVHNALLGTAANTRCAGLGGGR